MSDTTQDKETTQEKAKFKFKCIQCGACCAPRGPVPLTLFDIEYWASKKIINNLFPYMKIQQSPMGLTELVLDVIPITEKDEKDGGEDESDEEAPDTDSEDASAIDDGEKEEGHEEDSTDSSGDDESGDEDSDESGNVKKGKCPMFNSESNKCLIWADRPLYCRSFPLGYDGVNYFIKMDDCPGINAVETMDKELLKQMREDARKEFEGKRLIGITLPILQGIIMRTMEQEQMKMLSKLSPDQLEKLKKVQEIFSEVQEEE
ncbi:hypothetical protein GF325_18040 [Candidatus Bathyarchaeota archaeon]|nr:hypothetical protein [Candidatus Bathyarchaeota archaeon]